MNVQTTLRATAWLLLMAIAFATLSPLSPLGLRPRTSLPVSIERVLPFLAAGILFALAYPRHILLAAIFIIVAATSLDYFQTFRPDRHGRDLDAVVKVIGAIMGLCAGWLAVHLGSRKKRR